MDAQLFVPLLRTVSIKIKIRPLLEPKSAAEKEEKDEGQHELTNMIQLVQNVEQNASRILKKTHKQTKHNRRENEECNTSKVNSSKTKETQKSRCAVDSSWKPSCPHLNTKKEKSDVFWKIGEI